MWEMNEKFAVYNRLGMSYVALSRIVLQMIKYYINITTYIVSIGIMSQTFTLGL